MTNCKKVSFADEGSALFYIDKLSKTSKRKLKPTRAYLCESCLTWHLTSIGYVDISSKAEFKLRITNGKLTEKLEAEKSLVRKYRLENIKLNNRITEIKSDLELLKTCVTIIVMK